MIKKLLASFALAGLLSTAQVSFAQTSFMDTTGDIDPGISSGGDTLDIVSMEVSHTSTHLNFNLTVNGNISSTDWGRFMIGIATGSGNSTTTGNGWDRPINLDSPIGGMNYWIGSWVNLGGGSQIWSYNGSSWDDQGALASFSLSAGAQSTISYGVTFTSLGLTGTETIYFDAYSSAGGGSDSAVDALSNPNISITGWGGPYTSNIANGISSYAIPEPSSVALLGLGVAGLLGWCLHRRRQH